MERTVLGQLADSGQSIWLDYIRRSYILGGGLAAAVNQGVRGVTSNPAIFEKAIAGSDDYDQQLAETCDLGVVAADTYEALALRDIQMAADTLRTVYEATEGKDGFVSLEVSPDLAYDTAGTIAQARHLWGAVGRPNVLIKVPATPEGIPAIEALIGEGINVNVTLMFSLEQYDAVTEAYMAGLERRAATDGDLTGIASVASFFVSRVDVMIDGMLDDLGTPEAAELKGTIGIANAKMAYQRFKLAFSGERWERLAAKGASLQRPLWASTSTKNPAYPDTLYPDALIGPHTVNTLPPETLKAVLDHGTVADTLEADLETAQAQLRRLADLGIDLDRVTDALLDDGVQKFAKPFGMMLQSVRTKCRRLGLPRFETRLGEEQAAVDTALDRLVEQEIVDRIWELDYFVWQPEPTEISNRLGWLTSPAVMLRHLESIADFVDAVRDAGYTRVVLLGMGGSSLAPDVFSTVFGGRKGYPRLDVLDSTDPGAVLAYADALDLARTLFIASSKSGTTAETLSFLKYFYNATSDAVGRADVGAHFAAITDPGTSLAALARELGFRAVFENIPTIGGRYSALSHFGLVPAALLGVDIGLLLERALGFPFSPMDIGDDAQDPASSSTGGGWEGEASQTAGDTVAAELGVILGELAKAGRDKLTLVVSPPCGNFGDWVEQLVAESTGKAGTGILPVVGEPLGAPEVYGNDRLFVHLRLDGDTTADAALGALAETGHPVVTLHLRDLYDIGEQVFLWEMAVAVAGHSLGIQPFNQPNVEAAKVLARQMIATYRESGALPEGASAEVGVQALVGFLAQIRAGDYVALQAYVQPTEATTEALQSLRHWIRDRYQVATTSGYGPRYLHSTGQLHKGDGGNGHFIQFTADPVRDADIPDRAGDSEASMSFGILVRAQALGDYQALADAGRRVVRFHLGQDPAAAIRRILAEV